MNKDYRKTNPFDVIEHETNEMPVNIQCHDCETLREENEKMEEQLALCVEALEKYKLHSVFWETQSETCLRFFAKECLDKLTAMQSEGEK